jgi:capsular exopolysaccharide synthesis family protein
MPPVDPRKTMPEVHVPRATEDPFSGNGHALALPPTWAGGGELAGPPLPPALSSAPSMGAMFQALRRRWVTILAVALLLGGLAGAFTWTLVPGRYVTETFFLIERPLRGFEGEFDLVNARRTQAETLKSSQVLDDALKRARATGASEQVDFGWLKKNLATDDLAGPTILRVALAGDREKDVEVALTAVVQAYLQEHRAGEDRRARERIKQLQANYREWSGQLRDKRQKLARLRAEYNLKDPETINTQYQAALAQLTAAQAPRVPLELELKKAEVELAATRARLASPEGPAVSDYAIEEEIDKDEGVKKQREELAKVEVAIQQIRTRFQPEVQAAQLRPYREARDQARQALAALRSSLQEDARERLRSKAVSELRDTVAKLDNRVKSLGEEKRTLKDQVDQLDAKVEALRRELRAPDKLPPDVLEARDDVDQTEQVLKKINDEFGTLQQVGAGGPRVTWKEPVAPAAMNVKKLAKTAGMAGLGVFALVVVGFVLVEARGRRVYAADDVVQGLGINLVGTLPALPAQSRRPLPMKTDPRDLYWQNIMTESVDVIRTVLLHSAQSEALSVVMVTSAVGGEGKTSLASHLAASLARAWRKTLLVDCDLRNPAAHHQFDLPLEPGFSEVLRGEAEFEDVVRPTPVSRLWMAPAGKWDSHAIQALAQAEVRLFFDRLKEQYDFIIVDAPPVLPVADSLLIGQHADAVLFSILREVSRMPTVYAAHQRLAALGIRMLGAVVIGEKVNNYQGGYQYLTQVSQ